MVSYFEEYVMAIEPCGVMLIRIEAWEEKEVTKCDVSDIITITSPVQLLKVGT